MLCIISERPGVKDVMVIKRLNDVISAALQHQLRQSHVNAIGMTSIDMHSRVFEKLTTLQLISVHHSELLAAFKAVHPSVEFPALHKELFSQEGIEMS